MSVFNGSAAPVHMKSTPSHPNKNEVNSNHWEHEGKVRGDRHVKEDRAKFHAEHTLPSLMKNTVSQIRLVR